MSVTENSKTVAQGSNAAYIESLYQDYKADPSSLDQSWQQFFAGYELALQTSPEGSGSSEEARVEAFVNAYRRLGHLHANLNPLTGKPAIGSEMQPEAQGLAGVDPSREFHPANIATIEKASFENIHNFLIETYCGSIGADFREINDIEIVTWLQDKMESCRNNPDFSSDYKKKIHKHLAHSEGFEKFLQSRFLGQKRFSIEGLESLIPMLQVLADEAAGNSGEELCLGMAHRGRLNVLTNFMGKSSELMLKEFEQSEFNTFDIDGDVKYHLGFASEIKTISDRSIRLRLLPNPSHLEAVNPVVEGYVRCRQKLLADVNRQKVIPLLIHGDAAFIGQGIVAETLNLSRLENYETGGTIHIIANNQIGFTTEPSDYKSSDYSADIAKVIRAPVLHVNADDPEGVAWTAMLALAYRQKFGRDIVIDVVGYRRHGHNETDEPAFTQPKMYNIIKSHPTVNNKYSQQLIDEGVYTKEEVKSIDKKIRSELQAALEFIRKDPSKVKPAIAPKAFAKSMAYRKVEKKEMFATSKTMINKTALTKIGKQICETPATFNVNKKLQRLLGNRKEMLQGEGSIDWPMAELLAFATLAAEGFDVRLSGQDCRRGTFSSRHAVLRDSQTGERYETLNNLGVDQAKVHIIDSPLSEAGVVGFEFGYSVADRSSLVCWEAQYGDFSNGAQILFDQFLVACEAKWKQLSSLVLLLPHGHEGSGPEHSSARPERFLQLCGNNNIQVVIPATAAQYFHVLRRQLYRKDVHKPLVVMTPKSLLRSSDVVSSFDQFSKKGFQEILDDSVFEKKSAAEKVKTLVLCTGKIFYDLQKKRDENKVKDLTIVRVEQLYPFPQVALEELKVKYKKVDRIVWCQEEPYNMGAWTFVQPRLWGIWDRDIEYVGRKGSGTTAEGSSKAHLAEQERIITVALGLKKNKKKKKS